MSSFNLLDHVDNLDQTVSEIIRILTPRGLFLLLTQLNCDPTSTEPQVSHGILWKDFIPTEESASGMYDSILAGVPYNHARSYLKNAKFDINRAMRG